MRMTGPLVSMLLMLITISKNYAETGDVPSTITLDHDNWKTPIGYNQYGHQIFPHKKDCGGDIFVTEDYQYGILTSPNWPEPPPSYVSCIWKLNGLRNLFFVVNAFAGSSLSERDRSYGFLTVKNLPTDWEESFYLGGNEQRHATFLNNSLQSFEITMVTVSTIGSTGDNIKHEGFKLMWWTVPHADFSKIYPSDLWENTNYQDYDQFTLERKDTVAYLFTTHIHSDTLTIKMVARTGNFTPSCITYYAYFSKISFDNGIKSTKQRNCNFQSSESWSTFSVDNSALVGIEIRIDKTRRLEMMYSFSASKSTNCPAKNASDKEGVGHIYLGSFESGNEQNKYQPNAQCQDYIPIPPDVQDVFMQIRMRTDIQPSPSCVADYLKIGSQRVCGINGPDTYISSPVDNSLIDRTGTYYVNVTRYSGSVFASEPVSENCTESLALNTDISQCYMSQPEFPPHYWVIDLIEVFTVHGVRILPYPPPNETIVAVYVKTDETDPWPVPSYQTCWRAPLISEMEISRCNPPVSGQFLAIVKSTADLVLCMVQVFVNIASPVKAWRNAVYGKEPEIHTEANTSIQDKHFLVDGDPLTCIEQTFEPDDYLKFTLGDDDLTVHAVMLYFQSAEQTVAFQSYGANRWQRGDDIKPDMKSICVIYDGPTDQQGAILLSCQMPLRTKDFFVANITNGTTLCEVIIYADTKDQTINYAALHKPATKSLLSNGDELTAPALVDGNLMSCDSTDHEFILDLLTLHVVDRVNLHIGAQKGSVFVRVWVSPDTAEVKEKLSPESQCKKYMGDASKHHLHVHHEKLKLSLMCAPPKMGRYVILQITNDTASVLQLCELQVIAVPYAKIMDFQNVALFKHAWQGPKSAPPSVLDSQQILFYGHGARLAVDGERGESDTNLTCSTLLTDGNIEAWWTVDLVNIYEVHSVSLFLCSAQTNTSVAVNIFISHALGNTRCYTGPPHDDLKCSTSIRGRFVQLITNQDLCLCEVEVMATPLLSYELFGEMPEFINGSLKQRFSFVTDDQIQNIGFWASYKINNLRNFTSLVDCGNVVRPIHETLLSPSYPERYALPDDNYICHWMIPTSTNGFIVVFIDYMNLRVSSGEDKCFHDALIFSNSAGQQITKCGFIRNQSLSIQSFVGDYLHVTLMVRNSKTPMNSVVPERGGFKLRFRVYMDCTERLFSLTTSHMFRVYDPMHSQAYPPFAWCSWIMNVVNMGTLRIEFVTLDLNQVGPECGDDDDDVLTIDSNRYGQRNYCSQGLKFGYPDIFQRKPDINMIVQAGDTLTFVFKTREGKNREGFSLKVYYDPYGEMHGHYFESKEKVIKSLGYPNSYDPAKTRIIWTFTSRNESGKANLNFSDLNLWSKDSSGPDSAYFHVESYLPTLSETRFILSSRKYNDGTKQEDRYTTFEVYPKSVLEVTFYPDIRKGKHNVRFQFSVSFDRAPFKTGRPKAFVAEETVTHYEATSQGFTFSHISLNENMRVAQNRFVYILEDGIYLISIRAAPILGMEWENLELHVNMNRSELSVASTQGAAATLTAALILNIGDVLSVVNTRGMGLEKLSMFTVVYISPVEGGVVFTGFQRERSDSSEFMSFKHHIINSGFDIFRLGYNMYKHRGSGTFKHIETMPLHQTFIVRVTGIYWITIRLAVHHSSLRSTSMVLEALSETDATAETYGAIPVSTSLAHYLNNKTSFAVSRLSGATDNRSLLSVVLLMYNKEPYTGEHKYLAANMFIVRDKHYTESNPTVVFDRVTMNCGGMVNNKTRLIIPTDGLYLVSIRSGQSTDILCFLQYLYVRVNGHIRYTCITMDANPTGQMTVLRLRANDILTVSVRQNDRVLLGTMLSVAFVQP